MFHTGLQRRSIHHDRNVSSYIKKKTSYKTRAACRPCTCGGGWSAKRSIQSIIIRKSTLLGPVGDAFSRQRSCLLVAAHRMDVFKGQILQGEKTVTMTFSVPKYLMSPPKKNKKKKTSFQLFLKLAGSFWAAGVECKQADLTMNA